jgi:addiction module HigA family antidote
MARRVTNEYEPDVVSPPGETLAEVLESRGMTQADLATRTGTSKKTISEIVAGKAAITPDMAIRIERILGIPARFWSNRERDYHSHQARQETRVKAVDE